MREIFTSGIQLAKNAALAATVCTTLASSAFADTTFNGQGEPQDEFYGYYYAVTGGKFVNGQTADGTASGRTIRYVSDDPVYAGRPLGQWQKDGFFADTAGVALTMKSGATTVFDNNGLEDGSFSTNFYNGQAGGYPTGGHGVVTLYSMSNFFDSVYAGYFKVNTPTTVSSLTGYFVSNEAGDTGTVDFGFNPNDPHVAYRMNIFSSFVGADPLAIEVTNTGGFTGDVFTSDSEGGTFAIADTGYNRVGTGGAVSSIHSLTYTLNTPIVLQPGEYFFSHDASIVPEPASLGLLAIGGIATLGRRRRAAAH